MRSSILMSLALHMAVILVSVFGLPHIQRSPAMEEVPMVVELVSIASETNLPTKPETKIEPQNYEAKPQQTATPEPTPKTAAPQPRPEQNQKPELKPRLELKPKPKPLTKRKAKPVVPKRLAKVTPRRKPNPPDPFELVLKTLAQEIKTTKLAKKTEKKDKKQVKKSDFELKISRALTREYISESTSNNITMTERHAMINTIRTAIMPCWNIQPGAKGAQNIVVVVRASLSPEGRVNRAWVTNKGSFLKDSFKLAAAETAQRAVLNQACQPFKLDPKKYGIWRDVTLRFNPSAMFGR